MSILSWIIFGLIAGAVAKWLHKGEDPGGCLATIVIGVLGAVAGGWIGTLVGWGTVTGFDIRSFLLAVGGGVLLLAIFRAIRK